MSGQTVHIGPLTKKSMEKNSISGCFCKCRHIKPSYIAYYYREFAHVSFAVKITTKTYQLLHLYLTVLI